MNTAICQMNSGTDKSENLATIERLAVDAARQGARIAVFPEFAMYCTATLSSDFLAAAESLDGEFVTQLARISTETGLTIVAGMHEVSDDADRVMNTTVVVDPADGLIRRYHKQHLYDAFGFKESDYVCPGPSGESLHFDVDDVRFGLLTCYDLRFPEAARLHADAGVHVLLYPAAWAPGPRKEDHWNTLVRARAIENTFYVAAVSQAPGSGTGGSLIVDPMGVVLTEIGESELTATASISIERIEVVRKNNPSLQNRRYRVEAAV